MEKKIGEMLPKMKAPGIVSMPEDFKDVTLTQEETDLALFNARYDKYFELKKAAEIKERQDAKKPFTAEELKEFVLKLNPWFEIDDQAKDVFEILCQYFSEDPAFEKNGRSLKKGICLIGPVGVGKTALLNLFQYNKRQCFHMITVFDIETILHQKSIHYVNTFCGPVPGRSGEKQTFYQPAIGWALDDVGRESVVFDFGNKTDAISKIIQTRYFKKEPYSSLHITTNKKPDELEKRYDEAIRSRLREMFNYILYTGTDRRK